MRLVDIESLDRGREFLEKGGIPSWKRVLDWTIILVSLPFTLLVFGLVSLWIKIASPGPILFRQERVGFGGRRFLMFKFRTMRANGGTDLHEKHAQNFIAGNGVMTKLDVLGDPRIIRGGRILRASGLDELPQLFNVMRREMSLVGPRPCLPFEWDRLEDWQRQRYNAAPGLTGYWQVNGKNATTFLQMIEMDIWYTKNLCLSLDLKIMFRTFPAILAEVLKRRKAASTSFEPNVFVLESRDPDAEEEVSA